MINDKDFGRYIDDLIASAGAAIDSALMSDDFVEGVDEALGDIDNLARALSPTEKHGDTPDTA